MSTLEIKDLQVSVDTEDGPKEILKGVTLTIKDGETHAIMGPNGSGKSTLAYSIAGHPKYTVTGGTVTLDGEDVLDLGAQAVSGSLGAAVATTPAVDDMDGAALGHRRGQRQVVLRGPEGAPDQDQAGTVAHRPVADPGAVGRRDRVPRGPRWPDGAGHRAPPSS